MSMKKLDFLIFIAKLRELAFLGYCALARIKMAELKSKETKEGD